MKRISLSEAKQVSELRSTLGERTFRQLLTAEDSRLLSRRRLERLERGSGKLSEREQNQLEQIAKNKVRIRQLKAKGKGKQEYKVNRSLRTWLNEGKEKGARVDSQNPDDKAHVITALWYLGVDPSDGTFYVKRG